MWFSCALLTTTPLRLNCHPTHGAHERVAGGESAGLRDRHRDGGGAGLGSRRGHRDGAVRAAPAEYVPASIVTLPRSLMVGASFTRVTVVVTVAVSDTAPLRAV